jgi:hypothetical protein
VRNVISELQCLVIRRPFLRHLEPPHGHASPSGDDTHWDATLSPLDRFVSLGPSIMHHATNGASARLLLCVCLSPGSIVAQREMPNSSAIGVDEAGAVGLQIAEEAPQRIDYPSGSS